MTTSVVHLFYLLFDRVNSVIVTPLSFLITDGIHGLEACYWDVGLVVTCSSRSQIGTKVRAGERRQQLARR